MPFLSLLINLPIISNGKNEDYTVNVCDFCIPVQANLHLALTLYTCALALPREEIRVTQGRAFSSDWGIPLGRNMTTYQWLKANLDFTMKWSQVYFVTTRICKGINKCSLSRHESCCSVSTNGV